MKAGALKGYGQVISGTENAMDDELNRYERSMDKILGKARGDWSKKLSQGTWGMRKKAYSVWYENGKLRKESRSELFAVAKDASEIDFWDVLEAIGNFLLGVLAVIALILLVLVLVWAIGALLGYLAGMLMALVGETLVGAFLASLGTLLEAGIVWLLESTVFWVAASAYGVYSGAKTITNAKNNPNLTRNQAAYEYGYGTGEIVTSLLPAWFKFKKLRTSGGKVNGFSVSKGSGYGARPRFDFHKLSNTNNSKATSRMTIPKWLDGKKLPHYHRGKGNNLRYHRPWEISPDGKRKW